MFQLRVKNLGNLTICKLSNKSKDKQNKDPINFYLKYSIGFINEFYKKTLDIFPTLV